MNTKSNRLRRALGCFLNFPALLCLALVSAILISCTTTQRAPLTLAAPPQIPGATFVGNKACAESVSYTISEPTRPERISYAVFCLKKKMN